MKKIITGLARGVANLVQGGINRLRREPLLVRAVVAAVVHFLVANGIIETGLADQATQILTYGIDVALLLSARGKVTADLDLVRSAMFRRLTESAPPLRAPAPPAQAAE